MVLADAEEPLDEEDDAGERFLAEGEHLFDDEDVGVDFGCGVGLLDEARDESIRVPWYDITDCAAGLRFSFVWLEIVDVAEQSGNHFVIAKVA